MTIVGYSLLVGLAVLIAVTVIRLREERKATHS
jgi:hypothetical protein